MSDPFKNFSIFVGDTEYYVRYPYNFNPYANLAKPRIIKQKTIGGTNYQESDIRHSDGKFVLEGQFIDSVLHNALWAEYQKSASERAEIKFKNNLTNEMWKVIIGSYIPFPKEIIYRQAQSWALELLILGKYINGELVK